MTHCYLRTGGDALEDAVAYLTIGAAVRDFEATARELDGYGQRIDASVHIAANFEELGEYPDIVLSLGPRGGLRKEAA